MSGRARGRALAHSGRPSLLYVALPPRLAAPRSWPASLASRSALLGPAWRPLLGDPGPDVTVATFHVCCVHEAQRTNLSKPRAKPHTPRLHAQWRGFCDAALFLPPTIPPVNGQGGPNVCPHSAWQGAGGPETTLRGSPSWAPGTPCSSSPLPFLRAEYWPSLSRRPPSSGRAQGHRPKACLPVGPIAPSRSPPVNRVHLQALARSRSPV